MADYLPHTKEDLDEMLEFLGMDSLEQLFAHIPAAVRLTQGLDLEPGMSEPDVAEIFAHYADANGAQSSKLTCFAGAGALRWAQRSRQLHARAGRCRHQAVRQH